MKKLVLVAAAALTSTLIAFPARGTASGGVCPADLEPEDVALANPWLLSNDVRRYPQIRQADDNGDGYACVFDPVLIGLTSVVVDDRRNGVDGPFQRMTLADVERLGNANLLLDAQRDDRNGNDEVLVAFIGGDIRRPLVLDNIWGDP
jgi:hypothetical protein